MHSITRSLERVQQPPSQVHFDFEQCPMSLLIYFSLKVAGTKKKQRNMGNLRRQTDSRPGSKVAEIAYCIVRRLVTRTREAARKRFEQLPPPEALASTLHSIQLQTLLVCAVAGSSRADTGAEQRESASWLSMAGAKHALSCSPRLQDPLLRVLTGVRLPRRMSGAGAGGDPEASAQSLSKGQKKAVKTSKSDRV